MDVWRREATKSNSEKYYKYLLVYTDDCLAISDNPSSIMDELQAHFLLKPESIKESTQYLGVSILKYFIEGDPMTKWAIGSQDYVKEAVRIIRAKVEQKGSTLKPKANSVMPNGFKPKLDGSGYVDADGGTFYMQCIGILQ